MKSQRTLGFTLRLFEISGARRSLLPGEKDFHGCSPHAALLGGYISVGRLCDWYPRELRESSHNFIVISDIRPETVFFFFFFSTPGSPLLR